MLAMAQHSILEIAVLVARVAVGLGVVGFGIYMHHRRGKKRVEVRDEKPNVRTLLKGDR